MPKSLTKYEGAGKTCILMWKMWILPGSLFALPEIVEKKNWEYRALSFLIHYPDLAKNIRLSGLIWQNQESLPDCMIMRSIQSFQAWSICPVKKNQETCIFIRMGRWIWISCRALESLFFLNLGCGMGFGKIVQIQTVFPSHLIFFPFLCRLIICDPSGFAKIKCETIIFLLRISLCNASTNFIKCSVSYIIKPPSTNDTSN